MPIDEQPGRHHNSDDAHKPALPNIWDIGVPARARYFAESVPSADLVACQDCMSELAIEEVSPGVFSVNVQHDDWCPWFRQLQRDLA